MSTDSPSGRKETSAIPGADFVHQDWTSSTAFLMATIGAAVGLGNLWRFPYITAVNGGGAFVLIYMLCIAVIALPLIMAELSLGRRGHKSPVTGMRLLAREFGTSGNWAAIGWISVIVPILGLMYYSVVAGWGIAYLVKSFSGSFDGITGPGSEALFGRLTGNPLEMMFWHGAFIAIITFIVARGLHRGLEAAVKVMMPGLFLLLTVLVGYAAVAADFAAGFTFMFDFDFSEVTGQTWLMAIGQAFFSVSVGVGVMITYGGYLPHTVSIPRAAVTIAGCDTLVALMAGLAIFPVLFAAGLEASQGPGLIFVSLPIAFGSIPAGTVFAAIFFLLLVFAALTSGIAQLEPLVSYLEEQKGMRRAPVTIATAAVAWICGLLAVLSFNVWADFAPLGLIPGFEEKTFFDILDYIVANLLIPLCALLIALFAGWKMSKAAALQELGVVKGPFFTAWRFLVRFVAPSAVLAIMIYGLISATGGG